jgi:hypothetical protein
MRNVKSLESGLLFTLGDTADPNPVGEYNLKVVESSVLRI